MFFIVNLVDHENHFLLRLTHQTREFFVDRPGLIPLLWGPPPPGLDVLRDFDAAPADRLRILVVNERG